MADDKQHKEMEQLAADEEEQEQSAVGMSYLDELSFRQQIADLQKNLHEEQLNRARIEVEKYKTEAENAKKEAENIRLHAELEKMKIQKQMDERMKTNKIVGEDIKQLQQRIAHLEAKDKERGQQIQTVGFKKEVDVKLVTAADKNEQASAVELGACKENVETRLAQLEKYVCAESKLMKKEERLKEWLATGVGLPCNVSLVRIANNKLATRGGWNILEGGLNATSRYKNKYWAHVHADKPFPIEAACSDEQLLYYFEVTVISKRDTSSLHIGLCATDFPFTSSHTFVGHYNGSFAIADDGTFWASSEYVKGHAEGGYSNGDVVGFGLLTMPSQRCLILTKNGQIWGKPILLKPEDVNTDLYPIVTKFRCKNHELEFNFGAKPFKYELAQLISIVDVW